MSGKTDAAGTRTRRDVGFDALDDTLRRSARDETERAVTQARTETAARLEHASQEADSFVQRARRDGEAAADEQSEREGAEMRRDAAATVLAAKQSMLDDLHRRVEASVLALHDAPDYPEMVQGLAARVRARLGPASRVVRGPDGRGGVIGEVDARRVDETLATLADRAFEEVASQLEGRWG